MHSTTRTWGELPANVMMLLLGSSPGKHRKNRIIMAAMTVMDLWQALTATLNVKANQPLPARDTITLVCEAILLSHQLQGLKPPPARTLAWTALCFLYQQHHTQCLSVKHDSLRCSTFTRLSLHRPQWRGPCLQCACKQPAQVGLGSKKAGEWGRDIQSGSGA